MKIEITKLRKWYADKDGFISEPHEISIKLSGTGFSLEHNINISENDIKDLEIQLTDMIKQLQDYKMSKKEEEE
jgi:hypothetical protein